MYIYYIYITLILCTKWGIRRKGKGEPCLVTTTDDVAGAPCPTLAPSLASWWA